MVEHCDYELLIRLDPNNARTAQTAGVEFARNLAGAPSEWFMVALGEQEAIIRAGIRRGWLAQPEGTTRGRCVRHRGARGMATDRPRGASYVGHGIMRLARAGVSRSAT